MLSSGDQRHLQQLLSEALVILCRSVIEFQKEIAIKACVDLTVDKCKTYTFDVNNTTYKQTEISEKSDVAVRKIKRKRRGSSVAKQEGVISHVSTSHVLLNEIKQLAHNSKQQRGDGQKLQSDDTDSEYKCEQVDEEVQDVDSVGAGHDNGRNLSSEIKVETERLSRCCKTKIDKHDRPVSKSNTKTFDNTLNVLFDETDQLAAGRKESSGEKLEFNGDEKTNDCDKSVAGTVVESLKRGSKRKQPVCYEQSEQEYDSGANVSSIWLKEVEQLAQKCGGTSSVKRIDKNNASWRKQNAVSSVLIEEVEHLAHRVEAKHQRQQEQQCRNVEKLQQIDIYSNENDEVYDVEEFTVTSDDDHLSGKNTHEQKQVKEQVEWSFVDKDTMVADNVLCGAETALIAEEKQIDFEPAVLQIEPQYTNDENNIMHETTVIIPEDTVIDSANMVSLLLSPTKTHVTSDDSPNEHEPLLDSRVETSFEGINLMPGQTFEYNGTVYQVEEDDVDMELNIKPEQIEIPAKQYVMRKGNHTSSKKPKTFMCTMCPQQFTTHWGLKLHERLHLGQYRLFCEICNKGFITSYNLKGHMTKHTQKKEFACEYCGKSFTFRQSLERHKNHADNKIPCKGLKRLKNRPVDSGDCLKKVLQLKQEETVDMAEMSILDPV